MPKTLFYLGVSSSLLLGIVLTTVALGAFYGAADVAGPFASRSLNILILLLTVPVAALFIRMSSLVAPRHVFGALVSLASVACACLTVIAAAAFRLDLSLYPGESAANVIGSRQLEFAAALCTCLAILSVRPYFRIQGGILRTLVLLPTPLLALVVIARETQADGASWLSVLILALATTFVSVGGHCLRHRHLFIEPTNLRELLDRRDSDGSERRPRLPFKDVAFDS